MNQPKDYTVKIEGLNIGPFSELEIDTLLLGIHRLSIISGSRFESIWFHVKQEETTSINVPWEMRYSLFTAMRNIIDRRQRVKGKAEIVASHLRKVG